MTGQHTPGEMPWGDLKVAFDLDNDEALWAAHDAKSLTLPDGWRLVETDCSGARCVAIFRVEGVLPTVIDGEEVRAAIQKATHKEQT